MEGVSGRVLVHIVLFYYVYGCFVSYVLNFSIAIDVLVKQFLVLEVNYCAYHLFEFGLRAT